MRGQQLEVVFDQAVHEEELFRATEELGLIAFHTERSFKVITDETSHLRDLNERYGKFSFSFFSAIFQFRTQIRQQNIE